MKINNSLFDFLFTGGLIYNMQYVFLMNMLIIPIMKLIDIPRIIQLYRQWRMDKKLKETAISSFS